MGAALTPDQHRQIIRLYLDEQLPTRAVAAAVGCDRATVYRALVAAEVPLRPRGGRRHLRTSVTLPPDVHIRTPEASEVAAVLDAATPDLATVALLWRLCPPRADRRGLTRAYLRDLSAQPSEVTTRIACRDERILAAAWWTTCTTAAHPTTDLAIPGSNHHGPRRTLLYGRLANIHPQDPHDHLLAIVTSRHHRGRGIGTALITEPGLDDRTRPRYLVLPDTGTPLATRIGCQPTASPLTLTTTLILHPWWLPTDRLTGQPAIAGKVDNQP